MDDDWSEDGIAAATFQHLPPRAGDASKRGFVFEQDESQRNDGTLTGWLHSKKQFGHSPAESWSSPSKKLNRRLGSPERFVALACRIVEFEIDRACMEHSRLERLNSLERVWSRIDELSGMAEARLRLNLAAGPDLLESPQWLQSEIASLGENSSPRNPPHPAAIDSAARLIRATLRALPALAPNLRANLSAATLGRVDVEWSGDSGLRWIVGISGVAWPGVLVRTYRAKGGSDAIGLVAHTLHTAASVVAEAVEALHQGRA